MKDITLDGKTHQVRKLKISEWKVILLNKALLGEIVKLTSQVQLQDRLLKMRQVTNFQQIQEKQPVTETEILDDLDTGDLIEILIEHVPQLQSILAATVGMDADDLDNMDLDSFYVVAEAAVEVNADSFFSKILPRIKTMSERLSKKYRDLHPLANQAQEIEPEPTINPNRIHGEELSENFNRSSMS